MEVNLNNTNKHPIVKIGNTVHRPTGWWTPSVHKLLNYLESVGFKYSPRVLGFDEKGREILSFIEGDSGKDGWSKITSEGGLRKFANLLREYHRSVSGFKPSNDSIWAYKEGGLNEGEIICHGDFGPWNVVWQESEPVGIVDWDFVLPANPQYDVFYALEYVAPFRDDETCINIHQFSEIPDRKHRIKVFLEAYGLNEIKNIVDSVVDLQRQVGKYELYLANRALQPQKDWIENGDLEKIEKDIQWIKGNRSLFE